MGKVTFNPETEIAQRRFVDFNGNSWFSTDLFYDLNVNDILDDERFQDIEIIVKLKEPNEKAILEASSEAVKQGIPY